MIFENEIWKQKTSLILIKLNAKYFYLEPRLIKLAPYLSFVNNFM